MEISYKQYINGNWQDASNGKTWDVINPATEETIETIPFGGTADANAAIEAANEAFPAWSKKNPYIRAEILKKTADLIRTRVGEYARVSVLESGKPMAEARGEWLVAANYFEWYAEEGKRTYGQIIPANRNNKRQHVIYQPMGAVGLISAWNFPAYNTARVWSASLAAGCTFVAKPSEFTPLTAVCMMQALVDAGLPTGVGNLVMGDAPEIGDALLSHPAIKKMHFTGSTRVGKILMDGASRTHTKLSLELGGNAPALIFPDVDLEKIVASSVATKFRNCGQVCVAPQRFLVHEKIYKRFASMAAESAAKIRLGNGLLAETQMGPIINAKQRAHVHQIVEDCTKSGEKVMTGGQIPKNQSKGYFYEPTVIGNITADSAVFTREIFGPVMPIMPFSTFDEAIELANKSDYGLCSYAFTNDLNTAQNVAEALESGMVGINDWFPYSVEAPFGGWKQSGLGAEGGQEGIREYMEKKLVGFGI
jgi:succinate-semialdehyde dehydrogenase